MVAKQVAAARKAAKDHRLSYRKNGDFSAFTYNQSGFRIDNGGLCLSKIGTIRIVLHRQPLNVKQVTICRSKAGRWYAVAACELLHRSFSTIIRYSKPVGIDVGIARFCHDSDDHAEDNPQFLTRMLRPLRRAHRKVSRRQVGSSNREKAKHMLALLYERIHNKRRDFLHNLSTYYSSRYDLIFLERLRVMNMTRNHRLARKILDASWSTFRNMLQYKANRVVEVEPAYTSIDCSRCGCPVPKPLAVRTHACPECRAVLDRDYNASLNILQRGLESLLPQSLREVTPVEIVHRSRKQEEATGLVR